MRQGWADKVDEALKAQGHSWSWLAERIDRNDATISRLVNGKARLTREVARAMVHELRIPFEWIFEDVSFDAEVKA